MFDGKVMTRVHLSVLLLLLIIDDHDDVQVALLGYLNLLSDQIPRPPILCNALVSLLLLLQRLYTVLALSIRIGDHFGVLN